MAWLLCENRRLQTLEGKQARMIPIGGFWRDRKYHLDKMTMRDLLIVFYQYPAIATYHALFAASVAENRPRNTPSWKAFRTSSACNAVKASGAAVRSKYALA